MERAGVIRCPGPFLYPDFWFKVPFATIPLQGLFGSEGRLLIQDGFLVQVPVKRVGRAKFKLKLP